MIVSATDVGGTTDGSKVTIEDTLPQGLTATEDQWCRRVSERLRANRAKVLRK